MASINNDGIATSLAIEAFKLINADHFEVSAALDVYEPKSLLNFAQFKSILLMAYNKGQLDIATRFAIAGVGQQA